MSKSAAILFVHNQVDTIGWWLAHHATIGFSTLIVCDDHSTDGTGTVLSNAATLYDIRVQSSDSTLPTRLERQILFHKKALEEGQDEFDWMMILAADEYLHFDTARSVAEFTAGPAGATISVNWCLFGSAGRREPSAFSPVETFTRHGLLSLPDHRVVRQFVRPLQTGGSLPDPFSALDREPNWNESRVLHFAAGDHQSFLREDPSTTPEDAWHHFDRNDAEYTGASRWLAQSRRIASGITQASLTDLYWRLKAAITHGDRSVLQQLGMTPQQLSDPPSQTSPPRFRFCMLGQGKHLMLDMQTGAFASVSADDTNFGRYNPLIMGIEASGTDVMNACLFTENPLPGRHLSIPGSPSLLPVVPLSIQIDTNTILSPVSGDKVHIPIPDHALTDIEPTNTLYSRMMPFMILTAEGHDLPGLLRGLDRLPAPDASALGCAIAMLPRAQAQRLVDAFPGLVPRNILPAPQSSN